jgi:phage tail sheath gpL-like
MSTPPTTITGFASSNRLPTFALQVAFSGGAISVASLPNYLLLIGQKSSAGTGALHVATEVFDPDTVDGLYGPGSELARMCYRALARGARVLAMPCADGASAAAGTATLTFAGTTTSSFTLGLRVDGEFMSLGVATGDTIATIAQNVRDLYNSDPRRALTATSAAGVVTFTAKCPGLRGNQHTVALVRDVTNGGLTITLAGGTLSGTDRVRLQNGTAEESLTPTLAAAFPLDARYYGLAANSTTLINSAGNFNEHVNGKSAPLEKRPAFAVFATGVDAQPTTFAQATNNAYFQMLWFRNGEFFPPEMAADFAAYRSVAEAVDPASAYDDLELSPFFGQVNTADLLTPAQMTSCLNVGITPIATNSATKAAVVRSITTRSQQTGGTLPDVSAVDTHVPVVAWVVGLNAMLRWAEFKKDNPRVRDDPTNPETPVPAGVATPGLWNAVLDADLQEFAKGYFGAPPIIEYDPADPSQVPQSGFDKVGKRIISLMRLTVIAANHSGGLKIIAAG